jgi:hypothetical protein
LVEVGHVVAAICHLERNQMLSLFNLSKVARTGIRGIVGCWPEWHGIIIWIGAVSKEISDGILVLAGVDL